MSSVIQLNLPGSAEWPQRRVRTRFPPKPITRLPEKPYVIVHDYQVVRIVAERSQRILRGHSLNQHLVPHWREKNRRRFVLYEEIADHYPLCKRRDLDKQLAVLIALGYLEVKYLAHRRCYRTLKEPPVS